MPRVKMAGVGEQEETAARFASEKIIIRLPKIAKNMQEVATF